MTNERLATTVCIAGGGPAGMMLGLLLARAGIDVTVLEKHEDFFRDFRGDTIHPSTLDLLDQLGLHDRLEAIPQTTVTSLDIVLKGVRVTPVDFRLLRHGENRLVFMPQWDLLELLSSTARELPNFRLLMKTEATGLLRDGSAITGVTARTPDGELEIGASLTVAADGRSSILRDASGLRVIDEGVPVDVLWFRLPRPAENPPDTIAYVSEWNVAVTIPRIDYYQAALLISKGSFNALREQGMEAFRRAIAETVPFLEPSVDSLTDWDAVNLLSVQINRLESWQLPGFLAIGDAAHAMSPAFGVGINYAIQDAVAAANLLAAPLKSGYVGEADLARVQARRERPVRRMQSLQRRLHSVIAKPGSGSRLPSARVIRMLLTVAGPILRRLMTRLIGRGFRPERIRDEILR